uniref:Occlusion derived envelope protein n=1 Tax=Lymantria dispar multicapsid nuclear polyhedrosis virus TaxID=10449 RepID=A0A1B1MQX6_NPVLD|nr:occlusion derived envelope protein [Lymantria dispar multiple nucleopolyhedrovirus]
MSQSCPFNIKVCISDYFVTFPHEYVAPQNDVGGALVHNLVVYVPTDEDVQYVDRSKLSNFNSVLVYRHELNDNNAETRVPKKNPLATVVYWNPILPIGEVGVGETRIFSVLLTNDLFYCNTMIVNHDVISCPIEFRTNVNYKKLTPIEAENSLFYLNRLLDDANNDFLLCFKLETPTMVKILSVKRLMCIFEFRNVPARYAIYLPDSEVDNILNKLMWERARRLMKGDYNKKCTNVNRHALRYIKLAMEMMDVENSTQMVVTLVKMFQHLILPYQIVPEIIVKLNTIERQKHVRLYCKNDSIAIGTLGPVPDNLPDDNPIAFDYSDVNNNKHLFEVRDSFIKRGHVDELTVVAARYNYFL